MSLINDALKRTQQADQARPLPPADLELRTADTSHSPVPTAGGAARNFLVVLVLVVVGLNFALWLLFSNQDSEGKPQARMAHEQTASAVDRPAPAEAEVLAAPQQDAPSSDNPVAPATPANTTVTPAAADLVTVPAIASVPAALSSTAPVTFVAARPALRLQTVVAHPTRPSAMVNGRILFVGDRVAGYTVAEIGQKDATLVRENDRVVITLP